MSSSISKDLLVRFLDATAEQKAAIRKSGAQERNSEKPLSGADNQRGECRQERTLI